MTIREQLESLSACSEAIEWAEKYPTLQAAWNDCDRADWMLWLAGRCSGCAGDPRRKLLVRCAASCAETAIKYVTDEFDAAICETAIQTCFAWSDGEATDEDLREDYATPAALHAVYATVYTAYAKSTALASMACIVRAHYPEVPKP